MEEQVSELVGRGAVVSRLDRVRDLVRLLDEIGKERAGRLLAVPGTAVGPAQPVREFAMEL